VSRSRSRNTNREQFRAINKALAAQFGGDNCHNLDRVMRLPGTINIPNEAKRKRGCVPVLSN